LSKPLQKPFIFSAPLQALIVIVLLVAIVMIGSSYFPLTLVDFSVYWSAGSVLLGGGNPYSSDAMILAQQAIGVEGENAAMMMYWYPPWTLPLSMIMGWINYPTSQLLWYLLSIASILFSAFLLWRQYRGNMRSLRIGWLVAFTFAPVVFALFFGQVSPLMLLGLCVFLELIHHKSPRFDLLAGVALILPASKPTLLVLFWPALLVWSLATRRLWILIGLVLSLGGGVLLSMLFRPAILLDYIEFLHTAQVANWRVPTIGFWLRQVVGQELVILQFIPVLVGLAWLIFHGLKQQYPWMWTDQISWISLLSLVVTPFAWTHDQVIFLPAIFGIVVPLLERKRAHAANFMLFAAWIVFNLVMFVTHLAHDDSWFVWQAPVIFLAYSLFRRELTFQPPTPHQEDQ
jgi:hypothetical protein